MGATARSEIDTEHSKDAQAQFERVQLTLKDQNTLNCDDSLVRFLFMFYFKLI